MEKAAQVMLVDTTVWGDYFNALESPHTERLERALTEEEDVTVLPLIIAEVLQGFRTESGFAEARDVLVALPVLFPPVATHIEAARLYRRLRSEGVTIRGTIDCIIAQTCLEHDAELLSPDMDFDRIAERTDLRLWRAG
jgi:predicted nucleic acid-binding protein